MQENALLNMQSLYLISKFSFFIDESTLEIFVYSAEYFNFRLIQFIQHIHITCELKLSARKTIC